MPEYTPGEWYGVVAGDMAVLLHPRTPLSVVRTVWNTLRERDGLGRPLESLLADGISEVRPFAAVQIAAEGLHYALRGDAEIIATRAGDQDRRTAPQVVLWTEDSAPAADQVVLRAPGERTSGELLPLTEGVVRAAQIVLDGTVRPAARPAESGPVSRGMRRRAQAVATVPEFEALRPDPAGDVWSELEAAVAADLPASAPEPAAQTKDEQSAAATEVLPAVDPVPAMAVPSPSRPTAAPRRSALDPHAAPTTPVTPVAPSAPHPAQAAPAATAPAPVLPGPASEDDHDGMTILSGELASIRQNLPSWAISESGQWSAPAAAPSAQPAQSAPAASPAPAGTEDADTGPQNVVPLNPPAPAQDTYPRVALSTGVVVPVDGVLLIGRAPQAARATEGVRTRLVAVPSPTQDISRTHAELRVENGKVLVTDLFSTNGITVAAGGVAPRKIAVGEAVAVGAGEVVDLGDGVTFTVEPPA